MLHDLLHEAYFKLARKCDCLGWNRCLIDLEIFLKGIFLEHTEIVSAHKEPRALMEPM